MTLSDISAKISFLTSQDSTSGGYPNADRLISINNYYNRVVTAILQSQDDWDFDDKNNTDFPILTTSLVANQQDYSLPSNALKIKRVEISYDGSNWYKAEPMDMGERSTDSTQTSINNFFQTTKPFYDVQYGSLFTYPVPIANSTNGLKLWIYRQITEFTLSDLTTGTKTPGFDANFHQILAYGPAYEFAIANGKSNLEEVKKELEQNMQELRQYYGSKDVDRTWFLKSNFVPYT
jgi:hypothetical protein